MLQLCICIMIGTIIGNFIWMFLERIGERMACGKRKGGKKR